MTRSNGGRVGRRTRQGKGTPDAFLKSLARSYGAALVFVGAALFATLLWFIVFYGVRKAFAGIFAQKVPVS